MFFSIVPIVPIVPIFPSLSDLSDYLSRLVLTWPSAQTHRSDTQLYLGAARETEKLGEFPRPQKLQICIDVAKAMQYLHQFLGDCSVIQ